MGRPKKQLEETTATTEEITEDVATATQEPFPTTPKKPKSQKKVCDVLYKNPTRFAIDFDGDGISFRDKTENKTDKVEVSFTGNYGSKSFHITGYKFI